MNTTKIAHKGIANNKMSQVLFFIIVGDYITSEIHFIHFDVSGVSPRKFIYISKVLAGIYGSQQNENAEGLFQVPQIGT
jgi:hypothetical protein